jgi:Zn-dependent M16 (insulinase) family peptidase
MNPALAATERLSGCGQARFMDRLADEIDAELRELPDRLIELRDRLIAGAVPAASQIGTAATVAASRDWLGENSGRFAAQARTSALPGVTPTLSRVGLAAPADVAFGAAVLPGPARSHPDAPALALLGVQLSYGYLWNEIRVKGGAYGARASLDAGLGCFSLSSFRDPNINRTLEVFSSAGEFVAKELDLSPEGIEQAIIGTVKTLDMPMRPPSAVVAALSRHLSGESPEFRRAYRTRLLGLDAEAVRGAAERLFSGLNRASVCVLASREKLLEENSRSSGAELAIEPLWERNPAPDGADCR